MKQAACACLLLLACPAAALAATQTAEQTALARLAAQTAENPVIRANFRQEKYIKALERPLVSRGSMIFAVGRGISWRVGEPYAVQILLTPAGIVERDPGGASRRFDMAANPFYRTLTETYLAVMGGDVDSLSQQFAVETLPTDRGWELRLLPRDPDFARAITAIELKGDRFVEEVRIREARGDESSIFFSDFRTVPADLDETEAADFAP